MKKRARIVVAAAAVAAAATALWYGVLESPQEVAEIVASGTVEATEARLGFQMPGRLAEVRVREGDAVAAGQELAVLDRSETQARRRQAEAQLAAARAGLAELQAGFRGEEVAQAEAAAVAARDRRVDAERDLERSRTLLAGGAISQEALDKARVVAEQAAAQLAQAEEQLKLMRRGPRRERIEAQRAAVAQAEATLAAADAVLQQMSVTSPVSGLVTVRHHEPGEVLGAGTPVLTVIDPDDRWVRIYVPEHRLGAVRLGAAAQIRSDTFPGHRYPGRVTYVAAEAEFTPKTVQTQEERVRLVFAVKVAVEDDPGYELKPGMPVDVMLPLTPEER